MKNHWLLQLDACKDLNVFNTMQNRIDSWYNMVYFLCHHKSVLKLLTPGADAKIPTCTPAHKFHLSETLYITFIVI